MWTRLTILTVIASGLIGCGWTARPEAVKTPPEPMPQEQQNLALEVKVRELNARIEEVSTRNTQLAEQCVKLKLENEQLIKQLAAVGAAPRERDQFKQQVAQLQQEVARLVKQLEGLGVTTVAPASAPADLPMPAGPLAAPKIVPVEPVPPSVEPTQAPDVRVGNVAPEPAVGPAARPSSPEPGVPGALPADQVKTFIINPPAATPDQARPVPEPLTPAAVPAPTVTGTVPPAAPAANAPAINHPRRPFGPEGVGVGVPIPPTTAPAEPIKQTPTEGFVVEEK